MAAFSASEIAFEGFRVTRERPLHVLAWAGLLFVLQLGTLLVVGALAGDAMAQLQTATSGAQPDPNAIMAAYGRLAPAYSIIWPASLLVQAMLSCAVYRAVLRPSEPAAVGGLKVGGDELRVLVVGIAIALLFFVVLFVGALLLGLVAGGVAAFSGSGGAAGLVGVLLGAGLLAIFIFAGVRLSLAAPMTFDQRDFRVFESWRATQGSFWPLFGAYFLSFVLGVLVVLLASLVLGGIGVGLLLATGQELQGVLAQMTNPAAMSSAALPVLVVYSAFNALTTALFTTIMMAPPAAAWRRMEGTAATFA